MTPEYLSSNVMNYLVLQYLNESGFYRAAESLRSSWLGPNSTVNDVSRLPFSHRVGRHALIGLAQDGLFLSTLEAEARNVRAPVQPPKFSFGRDHGPDYAFQIDEPRAPFVYSEFTNNENSPDKIEQDAEEEIAVAVEPTAEPPVRKTQKRKRKSGNDKIAPAINGDANDTDTADAVQPPTHEPSVEPMEIEQQVFSPIITTAEIGFERGTSAEAQPRDLSADASYIKGDAEITSLDWDPEDAGTLFIGGSNQAEMRIMPRDTPAADSLIPAISIDMGRNIFEVGQFTWINSHEAVIVTSEHADNYSPLLPVQNTLRRVPQFGKTPRIFAKVIGTITALEYERTSKQLVCLSLKGDQTFVHIWDLSNEECALITRKTLEPGDVLLDAAWLGQKQFITCGEGHLKRFTNTGSGDFDYIELAPNVPENDMSGFKVRVEPLHKRMALVLGADQQTKMMCATGGIKLDPIKLRPKPSRTYDGDADVIDLTFEPTTSRSEARPTDRRRIAIAYDDGSIELWTSRLGEGEHMPEQSADIIQTFTHPHLSTIGAMAFSPDGSYLAAASFSTVIIWSLVNVPDWPPSYQNGDAEHAAKSTVAPFAIWKWRVDDEDQQDGWRPDPSGDEHLEWMHMLKWSSNDDGDEGRNGRIAYGLNTRVAIIDPKV